MWWKKGRKEKIDSRDTATASKLGSIEFQYLEETGEGSGGSNSAFFFDESSQTDLVI